MKIYPADAYQREYLSIDITYTFFNINKAVSFCYKNIIFYSFHLETRKFLIRKNVLAHKKAMK